MRLERGAEIAGIEPDLARRIARACSTGAFTRYVASRVHLDVAEVWPLLETLESAGYLRRRDRLAGEGDTEWSLTIAGSALRMATFSRPITRATADRLLAGIIERTREYNADDSKPYVVDEVMVLGSYLEPEVTHLGDLDVTVKLSPRSEDSDSSEALLEYARRTGRYFPTLVAELDWARLELFMALAQRSSYVHVHQEDTRKLTDRWKVVFP